MKTLGSGLIWSIQCYNAMLAAFAAGLREFEFNGVVWETDDVFADFTRDLKAGKLAGNVKKAY